MPTSATFQTSETTEGSTSLVVPLMKEPGMLPAFFNPKGSFVRDVSIVCYKAYSKLFSRANFTFADSLAGVGARGIRVANEIQSSSLVCLNDINTVSVQLAKKSAELNGVVQKCNFTNSETCSFLLSREPTHGDRFDLVDVDPFGTPSPFVESAIRAVNDDGMLSMSATDSAVLCGVYPMVALRKYGGAPLRTDYTHEVGMRLIFGLLAATAMRLEIGMIPLFCHHDMHYFRTYCQVKVGNRYSRENEQRIGFVLHCFNCGFRDVIQREIFFGSSRGAAEREERKELGTQRDLCPSCSRRSLRVGGPLWIGKIQTKEFVSECAKNSDNELLFDSEELDTPLYYDLTSLSQEMKIRTPRLQDVLAKLHEVGHPATRTRLNLQAIRTSAPLPEIRSVVREQAL